MMIIQNRRREEGSLGTERKDEMAMEVHSGWDSYLQRKKARERKIMKNVNDDQATSKRERIEGDGDGWIDRCSSCRGGG